MFQGPRCRKIHREGIIGGFHRQLGMLLRGAADEEVVLVAFGFLGRANQPPWAKIPVSSSKPDVRLWCISASVGR